MGTPELKTSWCDQENSYYTRRPQLQIEQDYPIDEKEAANWVEAICVPEEQEAARALLKVTRYVSFKEFVSALQSLVQKELIPRLTKLNWVPWISYPRRISEASPETKSSLWVTRLALEYNPQLASVGSMCKNWDQFMDDYLEHGVNTFVYFEDALYSGTQASEVVVAIISEAVSAASSLETTDQPILVNVIVAAPFSSKDAIFRIVTRTEDAFPEAFVPPNVPDPWKFMRKQVLEEPGFDWSLDFAKQNLHINITVLPPSVLLRRADELIKDEKQAEAVVRLWGNKFPVYFAHKMPDGLSSFPLAYTGYIPKARTPIPSCPQRNAPQLVPFVRGCEQDHKAMLTRFEKFPHMWHDSQGFFTTVPFCPFPPYKARRKKEREQSG